MKPEKPTEREQKQDLDDFHPSDAYPAIDLAFAPGWEDPKMDEYDHYEERKQKLAKEPKDKGV